MDVDCEAVRAPAFMRSIVAACAILAALAGCSDNGANGAALAADTTVVDAATPRDLADAVTAMMPSLERLSGLDRIETVRVRRRSREEARAYVASRLDAGMPPEERDAVRRTYVALGMLPDTLDLDALLLDLYTEQVLGYYDPAERTLFVVSGENVRDLQQVIAHELVHALQDQHTDLDSLIAGDRSNDRQLAAHAAMEGHAMIVMFAYLAEQATNRTVDPAALPDPSLQLAPAMAEQNSAFPVFRRTPPVIRESLLFPYISGASFVHSVWSAQRPRARYAAPIDSLLPQSTEQVMEPEDHFIQSRDEPAAVTLGDVAAEWRIVREDDFGQLETALFLEQHLGEPGRAAADGWGGDRYALLQGPDGADVIYWRSVWDAEADADRFAEAVMRSAGRRPGRFVSVTREQNDGRPGVLVIDAPARLADTLREPGGAPFR